MGLNQSAPPLNEEFPWTLRESFKARYVRLKVTPAGKVEVIVPCGFDRTLLPTILQQKRSWILRALQRVEACMPTPAPVLPVVIQLLAIDEQWPVQYLTSQQSQRVSCRINADHLLIVGGSLLQSGCKEVLRLWGQHKAKLHLLAMLRQVSAEIGLAFDRATVRSQKTLWGSCTSRKNISLNYKLLFLPPRMVRYVLIHELCHTVHLNHSPRFWRLVETHEPDYRAIERELREAWRFVPAWAEKH